MRQIQVDLDVYARIWANREAPEKTENEILRRLLDVNNEVYTSNVCSAISGETAKKVEEKMTYKIRWIDDVVEAFRKLGGESDLAPIYKAVERIRSDRGEKSIKTVEATIRRTIEDHSSDSDNFRSHDYFARVGRGRWKLR